MGQIILMFHVYFVGKYILLYYVKHLRHFARKQTNKIRIRCI